MVNGQFGVLTIDAQGNYTYTVNPETPAAAARTCSPTR